MKKLFCFVVLACCCHLASAQTTTAPPTRPVASKNDDAILVALVGSPEATWRKLAQVLVQRGYSIDHSDQSLLTLSTHPFGQNSYPIRVTGMVVEQMLVLRMYQWNTPSYGVLGVDLVRRRGGESAEWRELESIAQEMGGHVRYAGSAIMK